MIWVGYVALIGEKRNTYSTLMGKLEEKRTLGRPRHRWVNRYECQNPELKPTT
jgi:hypothetical protein